MNEQFPAKIAFDEAKARGLTGKDLKPYRQAMSAANLIKIKEENEMNKNFEDLKITIGEQHDGFSIYIEHNGLQKMFHFDQDDNKRKLVDVFRELGFGSTYEEWY